MAYFPGYMGPMLARRSWCPDSENDAGSTSTRSQSTSVTASERTVACVNLEIRAITPDEAARYRRAIRAGFLDAETVDDEQWARDTCDPCDRCLATFDGPDIVATLQSFPPS